MESGQGTPAAPEVAKGARLEFRNCTSCMPIPGNTKWNSACDTPLSGKLIGIMGKSADVGAKVGSEYDCCDATLERNIEL